MTPTHPLPYPAFDPSSPWQGASVLLTTDEHLFLVKRSLGMPTHAGQMGFFAGHKKPEETHPFQTACREFQEESGMDPAVMTCEGLLPPIFTQRGQAIVPVVARLSLSMESFLEQARSNGEWTDLLAVPWSWLTDEAHWDWGWRRGSSNQKILMAALSPRSYLHQRGAQEETFLLWGATARMVWDYLALYYRPR